MSDADTYAVPEQRILQEWFEWTGIPIDVLEKLAGLGLVPMPELWSDKSHVKGWAEAIIRITFETYWEK